MIKNNQSTKIKQIQNRIYTIRETQVMLDEDLAKLYQVETKNLNRAVKRNINRFPNKFRFQLTKEEFENLKSQKETLSEDSLRFQNGTLNNSLKLQSVTLKQKHGKHKKKL